MAVVAEIRTLATNAGYEFSYGTAEYNNFDATQDDLQAKDLIYLAPVVDSGTYDNGVLDTSGYSTVIGLGVKSDRDVDNTQANLDETYEQKYDRRLESMRTKLGAFIKSMGCEDNFTLTRHRIFEEINQLDENLDMMIAELQFGYNG